MAIPGPTTKRAMDEAASSLLRLARMERGWSQRQLAAAAGVPTSTVGRIESGSRQPSLVTLSRLLAAADVELRIRLEAYDDHDDVLDARRAALTATERADADEAFAGTTALLAASRAAGPVDRSGSRALPHATTA